VNVTADFGELLIYVSFALLGQHWMPFLWLGTMFSGCWWISMVDKDRSMSRHGRVHQEYCKNTSFFIPYIW
jgi:hypothetical protein